ncbi:unnamed protein product (macronuclear) [Paramecium tetraurelia]|uniref:Transmembrane protein n=1 Tax=Paramecium tetraurelia TaxID=5888 RepID=A0DAX9_PARTE|nr:uncharacterized protein GSPATT00015103001 [Paramecium tetraurelia]CAK80196.1 unnamed protein product [Paramecium tetraurelia]|eukprot:XP_001447593.1 hypothetical protein (macronuclear) [Paramecium tetraurelia strain d4-2]
MISLPFDKWKLSFYEYDFEIQYEEHSNEIRLVGFKILNLLMTFAALIALIIFVVQQQPSVLIIMMAAVVFCCFGLYLLSPKLKPRLKFVFSCMYIWSVSTNVMIAMSGNNIPNFFFGFNTSALLFGILQFSDNKLKIIYTIVTPLIIIFLFEVYTTNNIQFILHSGACMSFISVLTYMFEYTSRLAFSLNLIANKQKEIIDEFVTDSMFAISLDDRTRQFNLEFKNKAFESLKNIKDSEQIRQFLRTSYVLNNMNESQKLNEKALSKLQKLEEFFFKKIRSPEGFMNNENQDDEIEIIQQDKINEKYKSMKLIVKLFNFGKPILIVIIKTEQVHNLIESYEKDIIEYQQQIVGYSQEILNSQANINLEIKKIKQHFSKNIQDQMFLKLQCLNLQIMNQVRNYIIYFQQEKIQQLTQIQYISNLNLYLDTIQQYLSTIAEYYSVKFMLQHQMEIQLSLNINIKFLTQISINLFQQILMHSMKNQVISLNITEELQTSTKRQTQQQQVEIKKKVEDFQTQSKQLIDLKSISFMFTFYSLHHINLQRLQSFSMEQKTDVNNFNHIPEYVTCYLLDQMGAKQFCINQSSRAYRY